MTDLLNRELIKKILGQLGITSGKSFGKVGVTSKDFIVSSDKFEIENEQFPIWAGELKTNNTFQVLFTKVDYKKEPTEFILLLKIGEALLGIRFIWDEEDDYGIFVIQANKEWIPANTFIKLNTTAAIESVTNEGILWEPCKDYASIYPELLSLLDVIDDD